MSFINNYANNYLYITSHGIAGTDRVYRLWAPYYYIGKKKIINDCSTIFYPIVSFNYQDSFRHSSVNGYLETNLIKKVIGRIRGLCAKWLIRGWYFFSSLGQSDDCNRLINVIKKYCKDGQKCILQGVSRGASVILLVLALNPDLPVAAVILESPFDSIDSVLDNIIEQLGGWSLLKRYKYTIFTFIFKNYKPGLFNPIDYVDRINRDIPILIVCSLSDHLVHAKSSLRLYNALIKSGHKKTHILILSKGRHGFLLQGENKKLYESAVHNFYKEYDLPYDSSKINL
jgi:dienelactone hydrolase